MNSITQTTDICRQLLFIHHQVEALRERDPDAPDEGSRQQQLELWQTEHETLLAEEAALDLALTKAAPPSTAEGIRVLAELAMTMAERTDDGTLDAPEGFADWLTLFALTSAAGKPEPIPLPRHLPKYWAEADGGLTLTDPAEICFLRSVRETSPEAKKRLQLLMQAVLDHEPAQVVRDAAFAWIRGLGASEKQASRKVDQFMRGFPWPE